jgi:hypothetical protein
MNKRRPAKPPVRDTALIAAPTPAAVTQVKDWIVAGEQTASVLSLIAGKFPRVDAAVLLGLAIDELRAEAAELDADAARGFLLLAYREVYRRTLDAADYVPALKALQGFERQAGL